MILLVGMALAARLYDVAASGEHVAVARTGAIEVHRLDDAALVDVLPIGETEVLAVAIGGPWVVASTRTRMLTWRDGAFVAAWPWPDEHRRGMRVDPAGLVTWWASRSVGWLDAATGESDVLHAADDGYVLDATADGWIADNLGVLAPSGARLDLRGCRFGPGVVACDGTPAAVHALPGGEKLLDLPGERVVAAGPAGYVVQAGELTRWVGRDGAVRHEVAGRWEGDVRGKGVAIASASRLCVFGEHEVCVALDAVPEGARVEAEGPALLLAGERVSVALDPRDGSTRWQEAVGLGHPALGAGRAALPAGELPGLLARADGWAPGPLAAPKLTSGNRALELRAGDDVRWRGAGQPAGVHGEVVFVSLPDGSLLALDARDGRALWTLPLGPGRWTLSSAGGGLGLFADGRERVLVDVAAGRLVRRFQTPSLQVGVGALLPDWLLIPDGDELAVVDARTGAPRFTTSGAGAVVGRLRDGGLVRRGRGPGGTAFVEVRDGATLRWRVLLDETSIEFVHAWVAGDLVLVERRATVMAFGAADGALRWAVPTPDDFVTVQVLD